VPDQLATRLSSQPSSFFTRVLEDALNSGPTIIEVGQGPAGREAKQRLLTYRLFAGQDPLFEFDLSIVGSMDMPDQATLQLVRSLFAEIAKFDDQASKIGADNPDDDAELFEIVVDPAARQARLCYCSIRVNTEWEVHFAHSSHGAWECLGIPDWKRPGSYCL